MSVISQKRVQPALFDLRVMITTFEDWKRDDSRNQAVKIKCINLCMLHDENIVQLI